MVSKETAFFGNLSKLKTDEVTLDTNDDPVSAKIFRVFLVSGHNGQYYPPYLTYSE